jgi:hypothetical protein
MTVHSDCELWSDLIHGKENNPAIVEGCHCIPASSSVIVFSSEVWKKVMNMTRISMTSSQACHIQVLEFYSDVTLLKQT